jgi:predicted GIY-YIG superfamily endonuclease
MVRASPIYTKGLDIMTTGIYLIHLDPPYKHAKHYLGYADDIEPRIRAHSLGRGARLTQVARDAGIIMILVRIWEGADRTTERKFKNRSHVPMLCPICQGEPVQMPLMPWMPAYVPQEEPEEPESSGSSDQPAHTDSLFDFDAESEDYEEDMLDREFWGRGSW